MQFVELSEPAERRIAVVVGVHCDPHHGCAQKTHVLELTCFFHEPVPRALVTHFRWSDQQSRVNRGYHSNSKLSDENHHKF